MKLIHNSHTHCQAAKANAKTQAWQRVCLSNRTTKSTDKPADEEEHRTDNTGLAKVAVQCSADTFLINQSLVLRINICGENRHLRQARKRYLQGYDDSANPKRQC
jgi:hypothetical protein